MLSYSIIDPTGNITALVESRVDQKLHPDVARAIMQRHPNVEQVGFVWQHSLPIASQPLGIDLRMAGGEFCGNATMSASFLCAMRLGLCRERSTHTLYVEVSGIPQAVETRVSPDERNLARTSIRMPGSTSIQQMSLPFGNRCVNVAVVSTPGISHAIILSKTKLYDMLQDQALAQVVVRQWCEELGCDGLGLMFADPSNSVWHLTPLVYIPGADTMFWESSCASGSSAVGSYASSTSHSPVRLHIEQPGGILSVDCDYARHTTWLHGSCKLVGTYTID